MNFSMKILIVSNTPWDDNNSFGNSFSNIFGGKYDYEIANIYCQPGKPNTKVCKYFFQITEKNILKYIFHRIKSSGREVSIDKNVVEYTELSSKENIFLSHLKILRWQIFFWVRDFIWSTGKWKSKELDEFIEKVNPDLIFLPIYYSTYLNNIGLYVKNKTNCPMVGYISDDCYTLKQFSFSPLFWIDRLIKRFYVKKSIDQCLILYTITETQRQEYNNIFGNKCKLLYKGVDLSTITDRKTNAKIKKLVYAGNLGMGRWKTLSLIAASLKKINENGVKAQLFIYSQTLLTKKAFSKLNISGSSFFMGAVPSSEIHNILKNADVLIHVESFNLSERYSARLSFSTKIVDYFKANRCIFAVGWEKTGAIQTLKKYNIACVATKKDEILNKLNKLLTTPHLMNEYVDRCYEYTKSNHNILTIRNSLNKDLISVLNIARNENNKC